MNSIKTLKFFTRPRGRVSLQELMKTGDMTGSKREKRCSVKIINLL
jgi:hypothetical protein